MLIGIVCSVSRKRSLIVTTMSLVRLQTKLCHIRLCPIYFIYIYIYIWFLVQFSRVMRPCQVSIAEMRNSRTMTKYKLIILSSTNLVTFDILMRFHYRYLTAGHIIIVFTQHWFVHQWLYRPLLGPGLFFSFVIFYAKSRTLWTSDQPVARPLPTQDNADTE
jgi:hypothetical protein